MSYGESRSRRGLALLVAVLGAVLICASLAFAAGEHGEGGEHEHGSGGPPVQAADADRCDLGINTKAYNDRARQQKTEAPTPSWGEATFELVECRPLPTGVLTLSYRAV